jgi:hypothetical protein
LSKRRSLALIRGSFERAQWALNVSCYKYSVTGLVSKSVSALASVHPQSRMRHGARWSFRRHTHTAHERIKHTMIGDNVVLRPPRLSKDSTPITFAVRVAQLMRCRWVSKTEVHTHRTHTSDPTETVEHHGGIRSDRAKSSRDDEAALTKTDTICGRAA